MYAAIERKAEASELAALREKFTELAHRPDYSTAASVKTSNISINPFQLNRHIHPRGSTRDGESADSSLLPRREDEHRKSRTGLQYTNSLSGLSRSTDKREVRNGFDEFSMTQGPVREKAWREKVSEVLGEDRIKKKTKIYN